MRQVVRATNTLGKVPAEGVLSFALDSCAALCG